MQTTRAKYHYLPRYLPNINYQLDALIIIYS